MKITRSIVFLLASVLLFSSCSTVYITPPEVSSENEETAHVDITLGDEYFTTGALSPKGNYSNGYFYNGSWIYKEVQSAVDKVEEHGKIVFKENQVTRFVKYNPYTGEVSSLCRTPSCNHSFGSECPMMVIDESKYGASTYISSYSIFGDWIFIHKANNTKDYGNIKELTIYNLKTGELSTHFSPDVGNMIMSTWSGNSFFEGKLYNIKHVLDYSGTGYEPGGDRSASEFTPKEVSTLCSFDPETKKITELFEVPNDYGLQSITNKRFYFAGLNDDYFYSCTRDGRDFRREDVRTILSDVLIGSYVYQYTTTGFIIYDLTTNTQREINVGFTLAGKPIVTENGIYYSTYTTIDEFTALREAGRGEMTYNQWEAELDRIMYSGTAQIWHSDYLGENLELVYEMEKVQLNIKFVDEKFAYVYCATPTIIASSSNNMARSVIELETGKLTRLPWLDLFDHPEYIPEEDEG